MCGIAVIVSGIRIDSCCVTNCGHCARPQVDKSEPFDFTLEDLKAALRRRGPDRLRNTKISLQLRAHASLNDQELVSTIINDETRDGKIFCLPEGPEAFDCRSYVNGENGFSSLRSIGEMEFVGAVLQLRGISPVVQPLVDASGNLLVYNGEIFGGLHISSDSNDAEFLLQSLGDCCSCDSLGDISGCARKHIPELLSSIKGPWAMIYWQEHTKTLWFGRDAFGRRSLLVHFPTLEDARLLLSSVSPQSPTGIEMEGGLSSLNYWEELPCGVYSMLVDISGEDEGLVGNIKKHEWKDSSLKELISWERVLIEPIREQLNSSSCQPGQKCDKFSKCEAPQFLSSAHRTLAALRKSVARRTTEYSIFQATGHDHRQDGEVPVAILFSGGLDSMILAAILHEGLDSAYGIDLLNVSFEGRSAPDRITSIEGMLELRRIAPFRKWNLVEIDADLSSLSAEMKHVMSLINPAKTYMDLNIGTALWLAAGGDGWMYDGICSHTNETYQPIRYKSEARILLVGSGADEQCAGYGRHRTKYRSGSWLGLHEEMKLDMQRIWKRNLGRDDRCIADNGKEARFPFLDEDVIKTLLDFPLWEIAMLDQPSGTGDKKILREVACLLGIHGAAVLPKRAIQFGTRIAQESNKKNFGSNRAANQASAGSVVFYKSPG